MAMRPRFSTAEIKLFDAVIAGRIADYRAPVRGDAPPSADDWGDERTISGNHGNTKRHFPDTRKGEFILIGGSGECRILAAGMAIGDGGCLEPRKA